MAKNKKEFNFFKSRSFVMLMVLLVLVVIMAFFFGDSGVVEILKTQGRINRLEKNIDDLKEEKARLETEIKELEENPLALEKKAREKLWLMKKNEKVVVIVDSGKDKKEKQEGK